VKTGRIKDALIQPGFAMTAASASQLAAKLVGDVASYPLIRGTFTLPARAPVAHTAHGPQPAWTIRAGDNILIPDLPTSELASSGKRDGETLFHIVTTDTDLGANTIQLTVEGQLNRSDILVARLAAVTRVIGG
jgi:type 1 fimbria pilin